MTGWDQTTRPSCSIPRCSTNLSTTWAGNRSSTTSPAGSSPGSGCDASKTGDVLGPYWRGSELGLGNLYGLHEHARLVHGFLVLVARDTVVNDTAAGLNVGGLALDDQGSQGDAGVHVACEVDVADGPGVRTALGGFHLVDDLHGTHLGGAGDGTRRQAGAQGVEGGLAFAKLTRHIRRDVHDMRVALDLHQVGELHTVVLGDLADVVPAQIDEHDVFSPFLGI